MLSICCRKNVLSSNRENNVLIGLKSDLTRRPFKKLAYREHSAARLTNTLRSSETPFGRLASIIDYPTFILIMFMGLLETKV